MEVNFLALRIQQNFNLVIRCFCRMYLLDVLTMVNKQMMDKRNDQPNIRIPYRTHTLRARVFLGKESNAPINLMFHAPNPSSVPGGRNGEFEPCLARVGNFDLEVSVLFRGIHKLF